MRTLVIVTAVLLGLQGCTGQVDDNPEPSSNQARPHELRNQTAWQSEYDQMVAVLGLNRGESQALRTAFEAREAEIGAWLGGERGQKLKELEGALRRAAKDKDLAETRQLIAVAQPLRQELTKLVASKQDTILGALTPDQQTQWQGHETAEHLLGLMKPLELDAAQQRQIRDAAAGAIDRAQRSGQANPRAAAYLELEKWAEQAVLSEDQREAFKPVKKQAPLRSLRF